MRALVPLLLLSLAPAAVAQDQVPAPEVTETEREVTYKEQTRIDFGVVDLKGELVRPRVVDVRVTHHDRAFSPLVQLRTDWNEELRQSVDQVK